MQKGHCLQFDCRGCEQPVRFSVFELERRHDLVSCQHCGKKYHLEDENLRRQLKKFEMLCRQIVDSEEILANTAIGIEVGDRHVKIPYKLLLTRLNSTLELQLDHTSITIEFRFEPLQDSPAEFRRSDFDSSVSNLSSEATGIPYLL